MKKIYIFLLLTITSVTVSSANTCDTVLAADDWMIGSYEVILGDDFWWLDAAANYMIWESGEEILTQPWCDCDWHYYFFGNTVLDTATTNCASLDTIVNPNIHPNGCAWPNIALSVNHSAIQADGLYSAAFLVDTSEAYTIIVNGSVWSPITFGGIQYYLLTVDQTLNIEIIDTGGCITTTQLLPQFGVVVNENRINCDSVELTASTTGFIGSLSYMWENGDTTANTQYSTSDGLVWVYVEDSIHSDTICHSITPINQASLLSIQLAPYQNLTINSCLDDRYVRYTITGSHSAYRMITSRGDTTIINQNYWNGEYYVGGFPYGANWIEISDTNGCTSIRDTFNISIESSSSAYDPTFITMSNKCSSSKVLNLYRNQVEYPDSMVQAVLWSTGAFNVNSINISAPGEYVAITALSNGCQDSDTIVIPEPMQLDYMNLDSSDLCRWDNGESGKLGVLVGVSGGYTSYLQSYNNVFINGNYVQGYIPYNYSYSNPYYIYAVNIATGISKTLYNSSYRDLGAGQYNIYAKDEANCTSLIGNIDVVIPSIDSVTYEVIPPTCRGGSDGQIIVTPYGGGLPYLYDWDDVPGNQTDSIATALAANANGYYWQRPDVTVTNTLGCEVEIENIIITDNPVLSLVVDSIEDATCESAHNGQAALTITGGVQPYSFMWSDSSTSQDRLDLGIGTHTVTVTDSVGCIAIGTVAIGTLYPDSNFVFVGMDSIGFTTNDTIGITDHLVEITTSPIWVITDSTYYEIDQVFTHHWEAIDSVVNKYECGTLEDTLVYRIDTILVSSPFIFDTIVELLYSDTLCLGTTTGWSSNYVFTERDTIVLPIVTVVKDTADQWFLSDSLVEQVTTECGHLNQVNLAGDSIFSCGMFQYLDTFLVDTNYVNTTCVSDTIEIAHVLDTICRYTDSFYVVILPYQELVDSGTVVETIVDSVLHEYFLVYDTTMNYTLISSIEDWEHVDSMNYRYLCGVLDTSWLISNDYLLSEYNIDSTWSNMWSDTIYRDTTTTGVNDVGFVKTTIYPNPTQDVLNISFEKSGEYSVILYDMGGKLLRQKQVDGKTTALEMKDFSDGVYFVHMSDGKHSEIVKILKK